MSRAPDAPRGAAAGASRRLFFALWPDATLRAQVAQHVGTLVAQVSGRPQRPDQWHVTLEFLGSVPAARIPLAHEAGASVRAAPVELVFDTVEYWRRSGVLCLTTREVPSSVDGLVAAVRAAIAARGFEPEHRPYRPHLTLARRVRPSPQFPTPDPLHWPAAEFTLVESTSGPHGSIYVPLAAWPLAG